jgi:hypothetical protein
VARVLTQKRFTQQVHFEHIDRGVCLFSRRNNLLEII